MDESVIRQIEREGADALLDAGVSVPLKALHLPFFKKPLELRVTMRRPCLAGQLSVARTYLSMGVTGERMEKFTKEEEMKFIVENVRPISRIIAYTVCRGYLSRHLLTGLTAWFVRNFVEHKYMVASFRTFVRLMGTDHFTGIIKSVERANPMRLRLSQGMKRS